MSRENFSNKGKWIQLYSHYICLLPVFHSLLLILSFLKGFGYWNCNSLLDNCKGPSRFVDSVCITWASYSCRGKTWSDIKLGQVSYGNGKAQETTWCFSQHLYIGSLQPAPPTPISILIKSLCLPNILIFYLLLASQKIPLLFPMFFPYGCFHNVGLQSEARRRKSDTS